MTRVAFMILAHAQPGHLARLVNRLKHPQVHCFIHVDRKSDQSAFETALSGEGSVTCLPNDLRHSIRWCGFSMVAASLDLLRYARQHSSFDRFVLLSGADYPIKPIAQLLAALSIDQELIQIDFEVFEHGTSNFDRCVNRYFFGDIALLNPRSRFGPIARMSRLVEAMLPRKFPPSTRLFYGPSWWSLTAAAVDEVLGLVNGNIEVLRWLRWSRSPDEIFFQTAVRMTSRADRIAFDFTREPAPAREANRFALHYVDWSRPNPTAPRTLVDEDADKLAASNALFARKFEAKRSKSLLDAIDSRL